jgi:hypothetical protein
MAAHLSTGFFETVDLYRFHKRCAREGLEVRGSYASVSDVPLSGRMW